MRIRIGTTHLLILSLAFASHLAISSPAAKPKAGNVRVYLAADAFNSIALLPPPPLADSPEARMEHDVILQLQTTRTPDDVALATSEHNLTMDAFKSVVGSWFTRDNLPAVSDLFYSMRADGSQFIKPAKIYFHRPRPMVADPGLKAFLMEKDASYPSGHSTMGTLYAIVLSQLMPDLKDQLLARGQQIGWDRVIAGVHYPSDIQAGRVLGQKIAQSLLANPDFQEALIRARAEIKAFRDAQSRMDGSALENAHGH